MRKVEIVVECDGCLAWGASTGGGSVSTVPVVGDATVDLCATHHEGLRDILAMLHEFADRAEPTRKPRSSKPRSGSVVAEAEAVLAEVDTRPRNRRGGKRARAREESRAGREVVDEGLVCPLCATKAPTSDVLSAHLRSAHRLDFEAVYGLACPMCGHSTATSRALGTHGRKAHGTADGVPGLFALATREGDPLGVVAARAAALAAEAGGEE